MLTNLYYMHDSLIHMAEKALSVKLKSKQIDSLKEQTTLEHVADPITQFLAGMTCHETPSRQDITLEQQQEILSRHYIELAGQKPNTTKRVSLRITEQEYRALNMATAQQGVSCSNSMHSRAFPPELNTALESKDPES